jgi:DNA sulfur modification protein DndB
MPGIIAHLLNAASDRQTSRRRIKSPHLRASSSPPRRPVPTATATRREGPTNYLIVARSAIRRRRARDEGRASKGTTVPCREFESTSWVMLENILELSDLGPLARRFRQPFIFESINPKLVEDYTKNGWSVASTNATTVRMRKEKPAAQFFEDRVWKLLYDMQFPYLSGKGGATLQTKTPQGSVGNQLDVVTFDQDVALFIECKTALATKRYATFIEDSARLASLRGPFAQALPRLERDPGKRKVASIMWTQNLALSDNDKERATAQNIKLFDEVELAYYEDLISKIGTAAKYQFLADVFANTEIPNLEIVVPAIRAKMGKTTSYTFPISPSDLLKIAYVSHRSKGKVTDVDTYQRLIKKSRLKAIRAYIESGGYFPTNIVVNIDSRHRLSFQKSEAPRGHEGIKGDFGWLRLPAKYKAAWIIDGQHRLFAYAGSEMAAKSDVIVLAFSGLAPSEQAKLFVDINAEQKSVKQNLLVELWAELFWDSPELMARAKAVISKTIMVLDTDPESPLHQRVIKADEKANNIRCISLQTLTTALNKPEFFVSTPRGVPTPGAFWAKDNDATRKRAATILRAWLNLIALPAKEIWDRGKGQGGALAMNDGVTILLNVCRSVLKYFMDRGFKLHDLDENEITQLITPFGRSLGEHFAGISNQELEKFRSLRGGQGHGTGTRLCQAVISNRFPEFKPAGLQEFLDLQELHTSEEAMNIARRIEVALHKFVLSELKEEYGSEESGWWFRGIPRATRQRIDKLRNEEAVPRARESLFDLIDFRSIIEDNWDLFGAILVQGAGNKEKKTKWLVRLNEIRNVAAHPANGPVPLEDVEYLHETERWLKTRLDEANRGELEPSELEVAL